ncbi:hypothetical protein DFQ28_007861 [Apophysomyces sp. BC1034]|nr:hypothetical protein DFQ28_007861 [Apophysomyces sp. BC1034]
MGVMNFAHASFYMLGAYVGYTIAQYGGFVAGLVLAPGAVAALAAAFELVVLRRVHRHGPLAQLLSTFGLAYLIAEVVQLGWGRSPLPSGVPPWLDGPLVSWHALSFPRIRAFMMAMSAGVLGLCALLLRYSRIGLVIAAARTHPDAVQALGHDVARVRTQVFACGAALAALAGVIGGATFITDTTMAETLGSIVFVIVVAGGMGSLTGAFAASLLIARAGAAVHPADCRADVASWRTDTRQRGAGRMTVCGKRSRGVCIRRAARSRRLWLAAAALVLAGLPLLPLAHGEPSGAALALASQVAVLVVFALSYDLLLGQTGLLSFGHAMYYGIGALAAARIGNAWTLSALWLPLVGGTCAALVAVPAGWLSARRGGMTFAMVTLGLGELVAAAASTVPDLFGGVGGVMIDRGAVPGWLGIDFGSTRSAYCLVAASALLSSALIALLLRTPLVRISNAVRDNPRRAAFVGVDPSRVRWAMIVVAAFFAGVAGALSVVTFEIVTADSVSVATCATALIAAVIGGTGTFAGPIAGAVAYVLIANGLSSITRAWPMYVGIFFLLVVVFVPRGLAGAGSLRMASARCGWLVWHALAVFGILAGGIVAIQSVYALRFDDAGPGVGLGGGGDAIWWCALTAGSALIVVSSLALRVVLHRSPRAAAAVAPAALARCGALPARAAAVLSQHTLFDTAAAVTLDDVHVSYRATPVLRGVQLNVGAGQIHALIGPNGAGKSTLFNVLSGVTRPGRGTVRLDGASIRRLPVHRLARLGVARGLQTPSLFAHLSVLDNVCCAMLHAHGLPAHRWLQPAAWRGLRKRALDWLRVVGIDEDAGTCAGQLSYARQRALELAMATASGARLLLLDEPTAGMSRAEAIEAVALIRTLAVGRTIMLIEHDMDAVFDLADRISVLVDGMIIATGTPAQIRVHPGVRDAYLGQVRTT